MNPQYLVDEIITRFNHQARNDRFLVAIIGPPGSGKSFWSKKISEMLNEQVKKELAVEFAMDAYHLHNDVLHQRGIYPHKGCHFTFDVESFTRKLVEIKEQAHDISCPIYDRSRHNPTPDGKTISHRHRIVVVEGNYLLLDVMPWLTLKYLFSVTIYIEVDEVIQWNRLFARHTSTGKSYDEAKAKIHRTDLPNSALIERTKYRADYVHRPSANFP